MFDDPYQQALERRRCGGSVLFGATQTLKNEFLEAIRRTDILAASTKQMLSAIAARRRRGRALGRGRAGDAAARERERDRRARVLLGV